MRRLLPLAILLGLVLPAAPARALIYLVPPTACATGSNHAPAIEQFLALVPNGSTVLFPPGATCLINPRVNLAVHTPEVDRRADTTYDLNGATLLRTLEPACANNRRCNRPIVDLTGVADVTLANGTIRGAFEPGDAPRYDPAVEKDHGIKVHAAEGVTLRGLAISNVGGDCVDVDQQGGVGSSAIAFVGTPQAPSSCMRVGRQGVSATGVNGLSILGVGFDLAGQSFVDVGPRKGWYNRNVTIRSNTFGWAANRAVFATGPSRSLTNLVVRDNVQTSGAGRGFLFVGNGHARGPLLIENNRVRGSSTVVHMSGSATGNVMTSNPGGTACMFSVRRPPGFRVAGNRPVPGVREACRY